ncbi:hypothetical protein BaRGS_00037727, partial [Batillaria attramentaria]
CASIQVLPALKENASRDEYVLLNTSSPLRLTDDADGYLAINSTPPDNPTVYTLYIAKDLDYEEKQNILGKVSCGGAEYTVHVIVEDVNEFAPKFDNSSYAVSTEENKEIGTEIFRFQDKAKDLDKTPNQQIFYAIVDNTSPFIMTSRRDGDIVVNGTLDYESGIRQYILNISAAETMPMGSPLNTSYTTLTITITDVDDLGPRFGYNSTYRLTIDEGTYNGQAFDTQPSLSAVDGDTLNADLDITVDQTSTDVLGNTFRVLSNRSILVTGSLSPGNITLNIRAFQVNRPTDRVAFTSVAVTIRDINNHDPVMSRDSYSGEVGEEAQPGTIVMTVSATDQDQGTNGQFKFHLDDSSNTFNITTDGSVGIIKVVGQLDRETTDRYTLQVYAQEDVTSRKRRSNTSTVTVTVLDANDNSPVFEKTAYTFTVNQTTAAGTRIGQVNATDADEGDNGRVSFSITNTEGAAGAFHIDSSSGQISLTRSLTKSDVGLVVLLVQAQDNGVRERRSTVIQVTVSVTSVNQYPPQFSSSTYSFNMNETAPVGFSVGSVTATDQDGDSLTYTLTSSSAYFEVRGGPTVYVKRSLDLDQGIQPRHTLQVQVSDGQLTDTAVVTVRVLPVNEFSPVMQQSVYSPSVMENATRGTSIVTILATDADTGSDGSITYRITQNNDNAPVAVSPSTGVVTLNCDKCLDYNNKTQYVIVVEAKDGGTPPKSAAASVVISIVDINDKKPQFLSQTFTGTVPENDPGGRTVLQLQATDEDTADAALIFTISRSGSASGFLDIRGAYVVTKGRLDAETTRYITGTVQVSDGVNTDTASINVTVLDKNDNAPVVKLPKSSVSIPENTKVGTSVLNVTASDADVTTSDFTFWLDNSAGKFTIDRVSGDITTDGTFDRRIQREYDVDVWVSDNSPPPKYNSTTLHVVITDSNTAPIFLDSTTNASTTSYSFRVSENASVGSTVGRLRAFDADSGSSGELRYSLVSGGERKFQVDEDSGDMTLEGELDFETENTYSLTVKVTDNSYEPKSATAAVTVTVDNVIEAPQWPSPVPVVTLTQDDQCGDVHSSGRPRDVGTYTATDRAESGVTYSLLNLTRVFSMDGATGLVRTATANITAGTYHVGLRACTANTGVCSDTVATIIVLSDDVITFCPSFLTITVNESAPVGHVIADLNTTKGDNDVIYSFLSPVPTDFAINERTGVLRVQEKLDRETIPQYSLLVSALYRVTNRTATAPVTVIVTDAPDFPPRFDINTYEGEINEAADLGDYVTGVGRTQPLRLTAEDRDVNATLSYSIIANEDNSAGAFDLHRTTGEFTLKRKLDLETMSVSLNGRYTLKVMVWDGYFNDTATVEIRVLNDNDNSPQFMPPFLSFTAQDVPHVLTRLNVTDGDAEDRGRLTFAISPVNGHVGENTGDLRLDRSLDRETQDVYTFFVFATDPGGRNGSVQINVTVGDANDKSPVFDNQTYIFTVTEGPDGVGSEIRISAHDDDLGSNADLTFTIDSGDDNRAFTITSSGNSQAVIRLVNPVDREATPTLSLVVRATDGGQTPLSGTCVVKVHVEDVNDNPPEFTQARYTTSVSEGVANNTQLQLIPDVSVTDRDEGLNGVDGVVYSLYDSNSTTPPFRVDPKSGAMFVWLKTGTDLDREVMSSYTLTLVATDDSGKGLNNTAVVIVTLTDVNDHPPEFSQKHYQWTVSENVTFGHLLYVAGPLDRESQDLYNLTLLVTDGNYEDTATASVTVEDSNDNCPNFKLPAPLSLSVMENQTSVSVYNFTATDNDLGVNGAVTFFMNDTSEGLTDLWARDGGQPSCMTSLRVQLDVEGVNEYSPQVCQLTQLQQTVCAENFTVTAVNGSLTGAFVTAFTGRDADYGSDGHVSLSVTSDDANLLTINPTTGVLNLAKTLNMDDLWKRGLLGDDNATYTAEVTSTDGGNPPRSATAELTVKILLRAPVVPVFTSNVYNFTVPENQKDFFVGVVYADLRGNNDLITYRLDTDAGFAVDSQGNITTTQALDRERRDQYTYLVLAYDTAGQSDTASAVVLVTVVDENDNDPGFSLPAYEITVPENTDQRNILTLNASDKDLGENGRVTFTLLNTSLAGVFVVDGTSGVMFLNKTLDRETVPYYTLLVQAEDAGTPPRSSTAVVRVTVGDKNDNAPVFTQDNIVVSLDENSPPSTQVVNVSAEDPDEGKAGQVVYRLETNTGVFFINEFTGVIFTSRPVNFEAETVFTLVVTARDLDPSPLSSTATVTVYVNNLPDVLPQLTVDPPRVALVLGTLPDTILPLNVSASGGSGNFTFNITDGNDQGLFTMNEKTGQIRVTSELSSTSEYTLTIRVANADATQSFARSGFGYQLYVAGKASLVVVVAAVTLGQESYAAVRTENDNSDLPALLLDINSNAERVGIPVVYTLSLSEPTDPFSIEASTGEIYCLAELDRESKPQYTMQATVQLADSVRTGRTTREVSNVARIVVIVDDVNDNPPSFDVTSRIFGIPDKAPANTVVTKLKALDPDDGVNGQVVYTATSGDRDVFHVATDGEVRSLKAMSDVTGTSFDLTVRASDLGAGSLSSDPLEIKIVVVPTSNRFGLVAGMPVDAFTARQDFYIRNLSSILNMTLQLDTVEPHQGATVDTSKSDIFFYAFDETGSPYPFSTVKQRVTDNAEVINQLLNMQGVVVIPVTEPPERVRVVVEYKMGVAEIAVLVVSCLIFLGSLIAIIIVYRAWKNDMDPDDGRVFNPRMFLKNMRESESRRGRTVEEDEQECVLYLGNESTGLDTLALRRAVQQRETDTDAAMLQAIMEENQEATDSGLDLRVNGSSLSSDEHQGGVTSEDGAPGPRSSRSSPTPGPSGEESGSADVASSSAASVSAAESPNANESSTSDSSPAQESKSDAAGLPSSSSESQRDPARLSESSASAADVAGTDTSTQKESPPSATQDSERAEDPTPDYPGPKRVSFSGVLDEKNAKESDQKTPNGDVTDGVLNGWASDYDSNNLPTHEMMTAL